VHLFEGNKAGTKTITPVLAAFRDQHPETTGNESSAVTRNESGVAR